MSNRLINPGATLLDLCKLSRQHNVDIRIRQVPGDITGARFELRLDRGNYHAAQTIDITETLGEPAKYLDYAFERAKYEIKLLKLKDETLLQECKREALKEDP